LAPPPPKAAPSTPAKTAPAPAKAAPATPPKAAPPAPTPGNSPSTRKRAADSAPPPTRPASLRRAAGPSKTLEEAVRQALAAAAWRARSMGLPELYEAIGQDPTIEACPSVKRLADSAEQSGTQTRAHARGIAVSNAVSALWECAAVKFAAVEKARSAP